MLSCQPVRLHCVYEVALRPPSCHTNMHRDFALLSPQVCKCVSVSSDVLEAARDSSRGAELGSYRVSD